MNHTPPIPQEQSPAAAAPAMTCADLDQLNLGDALLVFAAFGTPKERRVATRLLNDLATLQAKDN